MEEQRSQFVKYDFYKLDPLWRRLPSNEKEEHKQEFLAVLDELSSDVSVLPYSLVGIRGDCDFLLMEGGLGPGAALGVGDAPVEHQPWKIPGGTLLLPGHDQTLLLMWAHAVIQAKRVPQLSSAR